MSERELYRQKFQARLDEWKADLEKYKARASEASADAQLKMKEQIQVLEGKIKEGKARLAEMEEASDGAWESVKEGVDSAWASLKSAFSDAASKFKN